MKFRYFQPSRLTESQMKALGVQIIDRDERETAEYDPELGRVFVTVGNVCVTTEGVIEVLVRDGARRRQWAMPALLTRAESAFRGDFERFQINHTKSGRLWWWVTVAVALDPHDPLAAALTACRELDTGDRVRLEVTSRAAGVES